MAYSFTTACSEMPGSPVEVVGDDTYTATVTLRCAWADRYALGGEIAAYSLYPNVPASLARAKTITIRPFTCVNNITPAQNASYEEAILVVEYVFDSETPQDGGGGDLIAESLEPTAQNLGLDGFMFRWKSGGEGVQPGERPSLIFRGFDYVLTKFNKTAIPAAAKSLVGCCNNAQVSAPTLGLTFAAETLLFNPPSIQRKVVIGSTPSLKWTITYRFTYQPGGWNAFWRAARAAGPGWDTLQVWRGGAWVDYAQYPLAAFTGL